MNQSLVRADLVNDDVDLGTDRRDFFSLVLLERQDPLRAKAKIQKHVLAVQQRDLSLDSFSLMQRVFGRRFRDRRRYRAECAFGGGLSATHRGVDLRFHRGVELLFERHFDGGLLTRNREFAHRPRFPFGLGVDVACPLTVLLQFGGSDRTDRFEFFRARRAEHDSGG